MGSPARLPGSPAPREGEGRGEATFDRTAELRRVSSVELGDFGVGLPRNVNFVEKTTSPILPSDFRQQFSPDVVILSVVPAMPALPVVP